MKNKLAFFLIFASLLTGACKKENLPNTYTATPCAVENCEASVDLFENGKACGEVSVYLHQWETARDSLFVNHDTTWNYTYTTDTLSNGLIVTDIDTSITVSPRIDTITVSDPHCEFVVNSNYAGNVTPTPTVSATWIDVLGRQNWTGNYPLNHASNVSIPFESGATVSVHANGSLLTDVDLSVVLFKNCLQK